MPLTTYERNKVLDHLSNKTAYTRPALYVGLSTTAPAADGSNVTEPSGGAYARVQVTGATWTAAASESSENASEIAFAAATASWGTVGWFVIYDAASSGNLLEYGTLPTPKPVLAGDIARFQAGDLVRSA